MKSVIQEASTIAKAIEQGWIKAGKPKDFTIKIFEEPKKNFLGFTTKNAKVGIFIEERQRSDSRPKKHVPPHRRQHQRKDRQWSSDQHRHDGRPSFHDRDKRHHEDYRKQGHDKHEHPHQAKHDDSQLHHEHDHHDRSDDHKKNNN